MGAWAQTCGDGARHGSLVRALGVLLRVKAIRGIAADELQQEHLSKAKQEVEARLLRGELMQERKAREEAEARALQEERRRREEAERTLRERLEEEKGRVRKEHQLLLHGVAF